MIDMGGFDEVKGYGGYDTRFSFVFPLHAKSETGTRVANYLRTSKTTRGLFTKPVFSDNGSEFAAMHDYETSDGLRETCFPNTPSQNDRVERCMRTVKECACAILWAACLTDTKFIRLWFYAHQHAANI